MRNKNFTLVPYIGETGTVGHASKTLVRIQGPRLIRDVHHHLAWCMSSQVKYGRDGNAYALHQLHRRPSTPSISRTEKFNVHRVRNPTYIEPVIEARLDLRTLISPATTLSLRKHGEFVERVERAFIGPDGRTPNKPELVDQLSQALGLTLSSAVVPFGRVARVMDHSWRRQASPDDVARVIVANYLAKKKKSQ